MDRPANRTLFLDFLVPSVAYRITYPRPTASVSTVALGACVIEKHSTLSSADKGPDSEFSLEPDDLEPLCRGAKDAWLALGKPGFERQRAEEGSKVFRMSLYFVKDLPADHGITPEDICRIRPGMGLAPKYLDQVVDRPLSQAVKRGMSKIDGLFSKYNIKLLQGKRPEQP